MSESKATQPLQLGGRLALRPREAAAALGLSERTFRALLPTLPHVRAGGAVLVPVEALRRWLDEQAKAEGDRVLRVAAEIEASFSSKKS